LPPPKIYRGQPSGAASDTEDEMDSNPSTSLSHTPDAEHCSDTVASSSVPVSRHSDTDTGFTMARCTSGQPADGIAADDVMLNTAQDENSTGEGSVDSLLQSDANNSSCVSEHGTCDAVTECENKSADRPPGDATVISAISDTGEEFDDDSSKVPTTREKSVSPPIDIPASAVDGNGTVNSGDAESLSRTVTDTKSPMCSTSGEVGSGGRGLLSPFSMARRRSLMSNPRFTTTGSFIIPADEDVYVDLSCGLFATDPDYVGRVQDVSTLPSPPERRFTIGDCDQKELVYFTENKNVVSVPNVGCQPQKTLSDHRGERSAIRVVKSGSTLSDIKVEMVDATSREVLDEIFRRTSGKSYSVILWLWCLH